MTKLILWGNAYDYDVYKHHILHLLFTDEIDIVGIACNEPLPWKAVDDIPILPIEALLTSDYDYIIDMNRQNLDICKQIATSLRLDSSRIIKGNVLAHPCFNLQEYIYLLEHPVTLIAPNCWAGLTYNNLGLRFDSPFINTRIFREDYYRLLNNPEHYLNSELVFDHWHIDSNNSSITYPIMTLDDVTIHFVHSRDVMSAINSWNSRLARIHGDNVLVQDFLENENEIQEFLALPYKRKIGFSAVPYNHKDIIYFPFQEGSYYYEKYMRNMNAAIYNHATMKSDDMTIYDPIRLLNNRTNYMRVE